MNNHYNYADFVGMELTSNDEYEPYGYDLRSQSISYSQESSAEIETIHD